MTSLKQVAAGICASMVLALTAFGQEARRCVPGPGATGSPRSIEQVVALINTLPKPVTIPCLVESLDRPLKIFATRSAASLQPSTGPADPRFFIFSLPLLISVTSDGPGVDLVEMSVLQAGNKRSLKGELRFPIEGNIPGSLPYDRLSEGIGTRCGFFCHREEARDTRIGFAEAFVSRAIRPSPDFRVSLEFLETVRSRCAPSAKSARCELLQAILAGGRVQPAEFPEGMPQGF